MLHAFSSLQALALLVPFSKVSEHIKSISADGIRVCRLV